MFAVIQSGGKQYKVKVGDEVNLERLPVGKSNTIKLNHVLLVSKEGGVQVGNPYLKDSYCEAEFIEEVKARKVIAFRYIRREKSAKKIGHRQKYSKVRIKSINV